MIRQHSGAMPDPAGFQTVEGLSCVENQVLLFLKERGVDYRFVYEDSLVPLPVMAEYMVRKGGVYTQAGVVPRIQDRLRAQGMLELTLHQEGAGLDSHLAACDENTMVLMQVIPSYAKEVLHARGWREDHYVRITEEADGRWLLLNDIPPLLRSIETDEKERAYAGRFFTARLLKTDVPPPKNPSHLYRICVPPPVFSLPELEKMEKPVERVQNLLLLYKVLRRRVRAYAELFMDARFMDAYLAQADSLQMKAAYMLIRRQDRAEQAAALLQELGHIEASLAAALEEHLKPYTGSGNTEQKNKS